MSMSLTLKQRVYVLPKLPHGQTGATTNQQQKIAIVNVKNKFSSSRLNKKRDRKKKVSFFSKTFVFYHMHLEVMENVQEQKSL